MEIAGEAEKANSEAVPGEGSPGPGDPLETFAAAAILNNLKALKASLLEAAQGTRPDATHDARIATRRLRVCLALFHEQLEASSSRRADRGLRRLGRALGDVRDLDVVLKDARGHALRLKDPRAAGFASFIGELETKREAALSRLVEKSSPRKIERLQKDLRYLAKTASREDDHRLYRPAGLAAGALIIPAFAELVEFTPLVLSGKAGESTFHAARRKAKRLRYVLEVFETLYGPETAFFLGELKGLQDRLGELNDAFSASRAAAAYVAALTEGNQADASASGLHDVPAVAAYLELQQRRSARLAGRLPSAWTKIAAPAFRKRLFAMMGSCEVRFAR
jgi:CHAD domain-containing protein